MDDRRGEGRHPLEEKARQAPESPGVYRFADSRGVVLYVGKARILRRRVASYFSRTDVPERTRAMLERARKLDFTVTASEVEAFILENTLIKRERPRFNVLLRDDKTYPYLKITTGEAWPRVELTRRVKNDGHSYFGPFMGHHMARRLMDLSRTRFVVRTCHISIDGSLERPCLYHHMNACLGPCVEGLTDQKAYGEAVDDLKLFLSGRHKELLPKLESSMWRASEGEDFERAASIRDLITVVRRLGERQDVDLPNRGDLDAVAMYSDGENVSFCVLPYRAGKLVDKREFHFEGVGDVGRSDVMVSCISQYYGANPSVPPVIESAVTVEREELELLQAFLSHLRGGRTVVRAPRRGPGARRAELATENVRAAFNLRFRAPRSQARHLERRLAELLGVDSPVRRIECFDISHASGKATTASCVVWQSGRMDRKQYRSFNIKTVDGIDDYAAIAEAVTRRYRRLRDEQREFPDLVLIDGGVGQLNSAVAAVDSLDLDIPVAALAKREEEIWLPWRAQPLRPDDHDPAHQVLRQARDEAHRFAVSRQQRRRRKKTLATELLNIPGVGPGRARVLIKHFGSVRGVGAASADALREVLGPRLGAHVWRHLHEGESENAEF